MDESKLLWGLLFGSVGIGYLMYGRRQKNLMPFLAGLGLICFPYLIDQTSILLLVGLALIGLPFVVKT